MCDFVVVVKNKHTQKRKKKKFLFKMYACFVLSNRKQRSFKPFMCFVLVS